MSGKHIPIQPDLITDQFSMDSLPRGYQRTKPITNKCKVPWLAAEIGANGQVTICKCSAWLPISVTSILDIDKLEDIWQTPTSKLIQQDVFDQKFTWCAVENCGILRTKIFDLPEPYWLGINIDSSCNLACPSCRSGMINTTSGAEFDVKSKITMHTMQLLENFDHPIRIVLTSWGDPLASLIMRPLIMNWKIKPTQFITLFTNGLLMKKLLPNSTIIHNISNLWISVDAGTKEVYENVRRPGKFDVLIENLDWAAKTSLASGNVVLKFTLSDGNAHDIVNFAQLCAKYNFRGDITNLENRQTYSDDFDNHEVFYNKKHPLHNIAMSQLEEVSHMSWVDVRLPVPFKKYNI
jgi:MoaA/NifB/PqqE/SkfB family radical SAM enzyme